MANGLCVFNEAVVNQPHVEQSSNGPIYESEPYRNIF